MKLRLALLSLTLLSSLYSPAYSFLAFNDEGRMLYCNITSESEKTVEITNDGSRSYSGVVNIPRTVKNLYGDIYTVTSIGEKGFYGCSYLTAVSIPNTVTSIGGFAFYDCARLESVNISDIEAWCKIEFNGIYSNPIYCTHNLLINGIKVTDLVIPETVSSIRDYAFAGFYDLTTVTIPESVTSIGDLTFDY